MKVRIETLTRGPTAAAVTFWKSITEMKDSMVPLGHHSAFIDVAPRGNKMKHKSENVECETT